VNSEAPLQQRKCARLQIHRLPLLLLVPYAGALLDFGCKSPDPMNGSAPHSSVASAGPHTRSAEATVPSALPTLNPPPVAVAPASAASALKDTPQYPETPCEEAASDFREYTVCWLAAVTDVRDALDATVLAERKRGSPPGAALAALLRDQEKWEKARDTRCNAKDNGQMGQGLGSIGQLSVANCRYAADRKRLAAFQAARDKP